MKSMKFSIKKVVDVPIADIANAQTNKNTTLNNPSLRMLKYRLKLDLN